MKVRTGFVSNSSSSSFLIYGIYANPNDVIEAMTEEEHEEFKELMERYTWYGETAAVAECFTQLPCITVSDCGGVWIGYSPTEMKDDQTHGEFKREIEEAIKKLFGDKYKCQYHEKAWYNG